MMIIRFSRKLPQKLPIFETCFKQSLHYPKVTAFYRFKNKNIQYSHALADTCTVHM